MSGIWRWRKQGDVGSKGTNFPLDEQVLRIDIQHGDYSQQYCSIYFKVAKRPILDVLTIKMK